MYFCESKNLLNLLLGNEDEAVRGRSGTLLRSYHCELAKG